MSYELAIHPGAEKEWAKLDGGIKRRFKEKLAGERLKHPRVAKDALRELPDCYKIKITTSQYRLSLPRQRCQVVVARMQRSAIRGIATPDSISFHPGYLALLMPIMDRYQQ
jgi:mRNA interferase RelE/StbE